MWNRETLAALLRPPVIGMVHLAPLPGSPLWGGDLEAVLAAARRDADALVAGGVGGLMIENFGDVPFAPGRVGSVTVAAMAAVGAELGRRHPGVPLGFNVLRNDADAALSLAAVAGGAYVRVNVHIGATVTDQGLLAGAADRTLRRRRELDLAAGILADLRVKHGSPLAPRPLAEEARDLRLRGLADALILTGPGTGLAAEPAQLREVRAALPDCPLLVGSGVTAANLAVYAGEADGFIVGTSLQRADADGRRHVDPDLVAAFVAALSTQRKEA